MIGFDKFWALYPRRDKKIPARKAWDKLSLEKQQKAVAYLGLSPFADREKCWTPMPTTFINQEGWEDEIIEQPRQKEEWEVMPYEDEKLPAWARRHGFPDAGEGESYFNYRKKLIQKVSERLESNAKN